MAKIYSDNSQILPKAKNPQILPSRCQICLFRDTCLISTLKFSDIMCVQNMGDCYSFDAQMREFFRLAKSNEETKKALWAKLKEL